MPDYKGRTVAVSVRQRAAQVIIDNPLNAAPRVSFLEEEVRVIEGKTETHQVSGCGADFDPAGVIPIMDPDTDLLTGATVTQAQAFAIIYSFYRQVAAARDAAQG
ncbi:MAG: hypothetical protein AB3X44_16245 [Leptothrix sp. (in: b-proteobacteria)]